MGEEVRQEPVLPPTRSWLGPKGLSLSMGGGGLIDIECPRGARFRVLRALQNAARMLCELAGACRRRDAGTMKKRSTHGARTPASMAQACRTRGVRMAAAGQGACMGGLESLGFVFVTVATLVIGGLHCISGKNFFRASANITSLLSGKQ